MIKIVSILLKIAEFHPKIVEISGIPETLHSIRMTNSILSVIEGRLREERIPGTQALTYRGRREAWRQAMISSSEKFRLISA